MLRDYTYINHSLFPVYINDAHESTHKNHVGVQRYNSPKWMSYVNNTDLDDLHTLVRLSNYDDHEYLSNNYYSNYQLITDLFDIILTKDSEFRNKEIHDSVDYMLRTKEYPVDLLTENRYTALFSVFHPQNNVIVLIVNQTSATCKNLVEKRKRLNEYL